MDIDSMADAYIWIQRLTGDKFTQMTWQIIPESPEAKRTGVCAKILHGELEGVEAELDAAQAAGCGVFACVNGTDMKGRRSENIDQVRAVWMDLDGSHVEPWLPLEPSMVVRTASGHHFYWVLSDTCMATECQAINKAIARTYGGDMACTDAARVLRVPGFLHQKGEPYQIRLVGDNGKSYPLADIRAAFPVVEEAPVAPSKAAALSGDDTPYGIAAATGEYRALVNAKPGTRNPEICRSAFKVGRVVAGGELSEETAIDYIVRACVANGYWGEHGERETMAVIMSSFNKGRGVPREPVARNADVARPVQQTTAAPREANSKYLIHGMGSAVVNELRRRKDMGWTAIQSPIPGLNLILGGGAPMGGVTLVGAPPGMGKSSFCMQWADSVARTGRPVIYFSLEMNLIDCVTRLCTMKEDLSWIEARSGTGIEKMERFLKSCENIPLYIHTKETCPGVEIMQDIVSSVAEEQGSPPLVVVDYIQLLCPPVSDDSIRAEMGVISQGVRSVAQRTGAAIVCISAVNRASYNIIDKKTLKPDRGMALSSSKETGQLEYDAEAILGLYLFDQVYGKPQLGWICVAKNRSGGPTGNVPISYTGKSGRFEEVDEDTMHKTTKEGRKEDIRDEVLRVVLSGEVKTREQLAGMINKRRVDVVAALNELMADNVVAYDGGLGKFIRV